MLSRSLAIFVCCFIGTSAASAASAEEVDVFAKACAIKRSASRKTDLQTDHAYKQLEGLQTTVTFRVSKVYEALLADYAIDGQVTCGIRVSCMLVGADVNALLAISIGDSVTCTGTATSVDGRSIWLKDSRLGK